MMWRGREEAVMTSIQAMKQQWWLGDGVIMIFGSNVAKSDDNLLMT